MLHFVFEDVLQYFILGSYISYTFLPICTPSSFTPNVSCTTRRTLASSRHIRITGDNVYGVTKILLIPWSVKFNILL